MMARSLNLSISQSLDFKLGPETQHVLLLIAAAVATMVPTLVWGIPSNHDLSNHFRFELPFYDALRTGYLYPGWLAESNHGFGDASFRFYPPALYYLLSLVKATGASWYVSTVVTFAVLSALGALGVYVWARELGSSQMAMLAGILYSLAPYRLNQFFQATLLAEFAGAAILPFAFAFTVRLCRKGAGKDVAGLAASYALLVLTHLPLAVIGSIALGVYAVVCIDKSKFWRTLGQFAFSIGIGLAASACYWTMMLAELRWIRADNINSDPSVDYRKNFVLSTFSPDYLNVWWMNILLLSTFAMFGPALLLLSKKANPTAELNLFNRRSVKVLALLLLFTLFMATPLSQPLWNVIHPLQQTQFPWRWLSITSMICPIFLAMAMPFWTSLAKGPKRPIFLLALGAVAISFSFSTFHIIREATWLSPAEFEQTLNAIPGSDSVTQWLPAWVHEPVPAMTTRVEASSRTITIKDWLPQLRVFHVDAGDATEARLQTFFYPHWKARAAGRDLATRPLKNGTLNVT